VHYDLRMRTVVIVACLAVASLSAGQSPTPAQKANRVLFIGNSLTYANELPELVHTLAKAAGVDVSCSSIARPDYSLEDHWNNGEALRVIRAGGWSMVILQQGPSALPESQVLLREFTKRFGAEIKRAGARTALYMVWPSRARRADFDRVSESYAIAATAVGGLLLPVGDAWQSAWAIDPSLTLYGPDGLHPSSTGTHLASLAIYRGIFNAPAPTLPMAGVTEAQAAVLRRAADTALARLKK
jgi:hypothetical protein